MNHSTRKASSTIRLIALAGALGLTTVVGFGCQSDAQTGGLIGAGLGALAGQAIGGDTTGTLIGAAVGAGAGYVAGNESDKNKARNSRYQDDYRYRDNDRYRRDDYPRREYDPYCDECRHYHRSYDPCRR